MNTFVNIIERLPEEGIEVIGYSPKWVHPDFNPEGTRVCFINGEGEWISAKWNNDQDSWHTHAKWCCGDNGGKDFNPTHWIEKPKFATPLQITTRIIECSRCGKKDITVSPDMFDGMCADCTDELLGLR